MSGTPTKFLISNACTSACWRYPPSKEQRDRLHAPIRLRIVGGCGRVLRAMGRSRTAYCMTRRKRPISPQYITLPEETSCPRVDGGVNPRKSPRGDLMLVGRNSTG